MRDTIRSLRGEIQTLNNHNFDLKNNIHNLEIELKDFQRMANEAASRQRELQAEVNALKREAVLNAEILRLTQELLKAHGGKVTTDIMLFNGKALSRKSIEAQPGFIHAIKYIREMTNSGLKEAKDFYDANFQEHKAKYQSKF